MDSYVRNKKMKNPKTALPDNPFALLVLVAILKRLIQMGKHGESPYSATFDLREIAPKGEYIDEDDVKEAIKFIRVAKVATIKKFVWKQSISSIRKQFYILADAVMDKLEEYENHASQKIKNSNLHVELECDVDDHAVTFTKQGVAKPLIFYGARRKLLKELCRARLYDSGDDYVGTDTLMARSGKETHQQVRKEMGKIKERAKKFLPVGIKLVDGDKHREGYHFSPKCTIKITGDVMPDETF